MAPANFRLWAALLLGCAAFPAFSRTAPPTAVPAPVKWDLPETAAADFPGLRGLCDSRATAIAGGPSPSDLVPLTPTRVFDNLYFVGSGSVSSWAVKTSKGIILIDALRNGDEAREVIEPSLRRLGLDPADIKYILVTHAHGDHYGGVDYLVERHRPRVVMSGIDWRELEKPVLQFDTPIWGRPPRRDIAIRDGDRLRLGDTSLELLVSRAHTPGTVSPIIGVTDGRNRHKVLLWGGTAFNFGPDTERLAAYAASADRVRLRALRRGVDVIISNHPRGDGSTQKMALLRDRPTGGANPFVIGRERVADVLAQMTRCAQAKKDWIEAGRVQP